MIFLRRNIRRNHSSLKKNKRENNHQLVVIITVTSSVSVAPLLSVTVTRNTYVPATRLLSLVWPVLGLTMVYVAGPLTFVHLNAAIQPSGSVDSVALSVGK